jgi:hypothetical protein
VTARHWRIALLVFAVALLIGIGLGLLEAHRP